MRLLEILPNSEFRLTENLKSAIPPYAILSHTWGKDSEEVTFEDMVEGEGQHKAGFNKIKFCGEQAARDGLRYFWVDSCCINKESKAELQDAISSMFRWYERSTKCYVYLSDVSASKTTGMLWKTEVTCSWEQSFKESRWFTRGWTLQELLAPSSVEFFSRDAHRLGDNRSLEQQIHEITAIPKTALRGEPLHKFTVNDRMRWKESRVTTKPEDIAYSLLGIFGVDMPLEYGEGRVAATTRLRAEIEKLERCVRDLRLIDPSVHKQDIEDKRGGLVEGSYQWILKHSDFQTWRDGEQNRLLWVKGNPGKGKTMLLCGTINELKTSITKNVLLSYFFCEATNSQSNSATAVLRGLIYMLVCQQPSLVSHVRKRYDHAGKALFEDSNAWFALSEIFTDILKDNNLNNTYLIVDALDECLAADLPRLLHCIVRNLSVSPQVKWLVSSRNWPEIEEQLRKAGNEVRLSLELNAESVSAAVKFYIQLKVNDFALEKDDRETRKAVLNHLYSNADGTFLWVALVCQRLLAVKPWNILAKLKQFPPGLNSLYNRMMEVINNNPDDAALCRKILALTAIVYRPVTVEELKALVDLPENIKQNLQWVERIIGLCGSFLTIRNKAVYLVHQSAQDFLLDRSSGIFPSGKAEAHHEIFSKSLRILSRTLRRDIFDLRDIGCLTKDIETPEPDPLVASRYSCAYWIDHLCDWNPNTAADQRGELSGEGSVDYFIQNKFLYWLEALSLCRSLPQGVVGITKLEMLLQKRPESSALYNLVHDAFRFIMHNRPAIEISPLQAYASALIFSPNGSPIRRRFKMEEPNWISIMPPMAMTWRACLQTLEGHGSSVHAVAFSLDGKRVVSGSWDKTIKLWDAESGALQSTLKGHSYYISSVAFSPNGKTVISGSWDRTVKLWDADSGALQSTLKDHNDHITSVAFSPDSKWVASGSSDATVKLWDAESGALQSTLKGHGHYVDSVAFSPNSKRVVSGSLDNTIKLWDAESGALQSTLEGYGASFYSVVFSPDGKRIASGSSDTTIKLWDAESGALQSTLKSHRDSILSVAFSPDGKRVASGSLDKTIKLWNAESGALQSTLGGDGDYDSSVAFSPDGKRVASSSSDMTVKLWDADSGALQLTLKDHSDHITSVAFSPDSKRVASGSSDTTVKLWNAESGALQSTLEGHGYIVAVAFSPEGKRVASSSSDKTIKLWDAKSAVVLETLELETVVTQLLFSANGLGLDTHRGIVCLDSSRNSSHKLPEQNRLFVSSSWVMQGSQRLLWLPTEYRPSCVAVEGQRMFLGHSSGLVSYFRFDASKMSFIK